MKRYIFIGLILAFAACNPHADGYKVNVEIEGAGDGFAILTRAKDSEEVNTTDSLRMKQGKFTFSGKLQTPNFLTIQVCPEGQKAASFGFIAENKPIQVKGKWSDVREQYGYRSIDQVKVEGSLNNEVYEKLGHVYQDLLQSPQHKEYAELQKQLGVLRDSDVEAYYKLKDETEELSNQFFDAVRQKQLELIRENRQIEAVVLTLQYMCNDLSLAELEEEFFALAPNVQESPFAAEIKEEIAARQRVQPGKLAPDFNLETPEGERLALSDLRGKYVVLDFWASWCRPCRASFPEMKKIYAKYKDKGLEILGVTNDSHKEKWLKALDEDQLPWKQVIDEFPIPRKPAKVATLYAIPYLPTLVLIDPQGVIVGQAKDKHELVDWLEARL